MPAVRRRSPARRKRVAKQGERPDEVLQARVKFARRSLESKGVLSGSQSRRLSARVDPGLIEEAKRRSGVHSDSELVNAALALLAGQDTFGEWLVSQRGTLSDDFELAI